MWLQTTSEPATTAEPMQAAATALEMFLGSGLPGAAAALLATVVFFLWRETKAERAEHLRDKLDLYSQMRDLEAKRLHDLKEAHQQRMADSEALNKQMLDVVKQCTSVMESTANTLESHSTMTSEHREAARESAEELRKLQTLLITLNEEIRARLRAR